MRERIRRLNEYLVGWLGYFAVADTPSTFAELDKMAGATTARLSLERKGKRGRNRAHAPQPWRPRTASPRGVFRIRVRGR
jgi:hypothetical protein